MSEKDGEPAFPCDPERTGNPTQHPGMSLRDYFAAKVLEGVVAEIRNLDAATKDQRDALLSKVAAICYEIADHMLEAREK